MATGSRIENKMQVQFGLEKRDEELPPDSCTHLGNAATGQSFSAAKPIQKHATIIDHTSMTRETCRSIDKQERNHTLTADSLLDEKL